ncbi:MAG: YbhB/YbcL family Raf kinase inhibitor-like protein [Actinomycetota bacterium]|nr:YbhB/YbcL family Raf kinase inhibitor-like protein [Actinomycetota bacterium]
MHRLIVIASVVALVLAACSPSDSAGTTGPPPTEASTTTTERPLPTSAAPLPDMELTSPAFEAGEEIPVKYTCDGSDISPKLEVLFPPTGTVTLAIIVDDPDAPVGVWDHWVEYDIPGTDGNVIWEEGVGRIGVPGVNSWNLAGYGGPCPPQGQNHRYFFTVFALDSELLIPEGVESAVLREAMEGKILAEAELMGTYGR